MKKTAASLVEEAMAQVTTYTVEQARALHGHPGVVFVDIRDVRELEREGVIPGSVHAPRGMLEFWVDPASPYHKPALNQPGTQYVLFCAGGWRSALAARTMQEMFDTALMLANQPPPPGRRIAILTNAGGPGSLAAGACRAAGLVLAELAEETVRVLADIGRPASNPVDLTPEGDEDDYRVALGALLGDRGVDAVIVLFIPPLVERSAPIAQAIVDAATSVPNKPVLASFLSQEGVVEELRVTPSRSIPSYRFPEAAATALGHAVAYNNWLRMPGGIIRTPKGVSVAEARILVRGFGPGELDADRAKRLLATFGIVADLRDADATPDDGGRGEDQHGESQDVTLRVVDDPIFGPVLALGSASMYAKLYGDIVYRITPLTDRDARMMVESLRSYPILAGTADRPSVDVDALVDLLLRVSALVESVPELGALDARRICVGPPGAGATVTSVHLTLTEPSVARVAREATLETR